ncbi:alpha/beta hydrolase [Acaryochloris sp. IP29b_bin.148]|uniref:alpha/beta hydrolase n=1 Tax=Acaryochloris sp. IP29b_bin.148 TaxID=2969218 RepID=UPI002631B5F6|nr:alpha/beta hydrolase [Acaryochloris sp. IP29b_bin.148]
MSYPRRLLFLLSSTLMLMGLSSKALPSYAAEKITVTYGPFGRSISVSDLRQYLETGSAPPDLASALSVVGQKERESLLGGLKFKVPLNVVVMDQLLRSPQGDQLLTQIAGATSLPGGAEKLALRSALIGAAASKEGVGALSFLEAYPTKTLKIDLAAVQKLLKSSSMLGGFMDGQFPGGETPAQSPDASEEVPTAPAQPSQEEAPEAPTTPDTPAAEDTPQETTPEKTPDAMP